MQEKFEQTLDKVFAWKEKNRQKRLYRALTLKD
jgi:hypothetical protein